MYICSLPVHLEPFILAIARYSDRWRSTVFGSVDQIKELSVGLKGVCVVFVNLAYVCYLRLPLRAKEMFCSQTGITSSHDRSLCFTRLLSTWATESLFM